MSVAVLVDLERGASSGGHVKCWERFAAAAAGVAGLDLTVYVLGSDEYVEQIAPNVRVAALRPVLGTAPLRRLVGDVDATDLAPYHPGLARLLPQHQVWHLTHCFSYASTALRLARRHPRALVGSIHTDVPTLTGDYVGHILDGLRGAGVPRHLDRLALPRRAAALARRRRDRLLRTCDRVLVASEADAADVGEVIDAGRVSRLRRGIDGELFSPSADPDGWARRRGIPPDRVLILFAGRVDATKRPMVVAEAVRGLADRGVPAHLVVAGTGADSQRISALLGPRATLLGPVPQTELAEAYAACDIFAFPSRSETVGNVVAEAMASGLPVLLPRGSRTAQWLSEPGRDGVLVEGDRPRDWADALGPLLTDPVARAQMGRHARRTSEDQHVSWRTVLLEDLLPVWQWAARAGAERGCGGAGSGARQADLAVVAGR